VGKLLDTSGSRLSQRPRTTILRLAFETLTLRGLNVLKDNPMVKRMFEMGEEQVGKLAQQLLSNEKFVAAMQTVVGNTLKAKGLLDKNIRMALAAMNLPSAADIEAVKKKLEEFDETLKRLEDSVSQMKK
jgi:hypothetical protein